MEPGGSSDGEGWGVAESVQFLISQGHSFTEIKHYSPQQFGIFVCSAWRLCDRESKNRINEIFIGTHADQKELAKITGAKRKKGKEEPVSKSNWAGLAGALNKLK